MSFAWLPEYSSVFYTHSSLTVVLLIFALIVFKNASYRKRYGFSYQGLVYLGIIIILIALGLGVVVLGAYIWSQYMEMPLLAYSLIMGSYAFDSFSTVFWLYLIDTITQKYNSKKIESIILTIVTIGIIIITCLLPYTTELSMDLLQKYVSILLIAHAIIYVKSSLHLSIFGYRKIKAGGSSTIQKFALWTYTLNLPLVGLIFLFTTLNRLENKFFGLFSIFSWVISLFVFALLYLAISTPKWLVSILAKFKKEEESY